MKIVQTFWSKPAKGNSLMDISAGWISPEYHWMSWALSCMQAKKFYEHIELVTDERGKEILINRLGLPYSSVNTSLEPALDPYPAELWSLAKIFSYQIQQQPLIHLDGDVFIWKPFSEAFCTSGLLAQNLEVDIPYYASMLRDINKRLKYVPGPFVFAENDQPVYASNTGIFGGSNIVFIKEYCRQAFEFVDRNLHDIVHFPDVKRPLLNFVFEQYLLFCLAAEKKQEIVYFMEEPVTDAAYRNYARLLDIPQVPLVHPVGAYKMRPFTCAQLAKRLRKEYPDHYYRIIDECKKEMRLVNKFYHLFEETAMPDESMPRTQAALNYMNNTITDDRSRQLFTEIEELELLKNKVSKTLNEPAEINRLYKEDVHQYHLTATLFEGEISLDTQIYLNKDVVLIELSHKWELPASADLASFISSKWNEEPGLEQVALWIEPGLMEVNEIYLSPLEMIIVSAARDAVSIRDVLQEARSFFDEEEISQNPKSFIQLVTNSIKLLLYSRILNINEAFG